MPYKYRVSSDFMLELHNLIPEVIPSQKRQTHTGLTLNSYGAINV
jgi:hypothetical protein